MKSNPYLLPIVISMFAFFTTITETLHAEKPIRIGATMSTTGALSTQGIAAANGYRLCEVDINNRGGLLGRRVEFIIYDDKSDPDRAIELYEKLITEDKVDAIMGPYGSTHTEAVVPVTEKHRMVHISPLGDFITVVRQMKEHDVHVKMFGTSGAVAEFQEALGEMAEYAYGLSAIDNSLHMIYIMCIISLNIHMEKLCVLI